MSVLVASGTGKSKCALTSLVCAVIPRITALILNQQRSKVRPVEEGSPFLAVKRISASSSSRWGFHDGRRTLFHRR